MNTKERFFLTCAAFEIPAGILCGVQGIVTNADWVVLAGAGLIALGVCNVWVGLGAFMEKSEDKSPVEKSSTVDAG